MKHITKLLLASALLSVSWMTLVVLTQSRTVVIENVPKISPTPIPRPAYLDLRPELLPVCSCESSDEGNSSSTPQQFNKDGSVRRGKINPRDVGMCQINENYWLKKSIELGYDIYTAKGNVSMANYIYDNLGVGPWVWSRSCHRK